MKQYRHETEEFDVSEYDECENCIVLVDNDGVDYAVDLCAEHSNTSEKTGESDT